MPFSIASKGCCVPDNTSDLLRRYLEQRREAGERELVLDDLKVEDVMRIVGAKNWLNAQGPTAVEPVAERVPERVPEPPPPVVADAGSLAPIIVGKSGADLFGGPMASLDSLEAVAAHATACKRCALWSTATNCVPGEGSPNAQLVCVGEAPGEQEDLSGRPFVGKAGQLLTKILAAIDLKREDVFICNVLKHRPPLNRNPLPDEVTACSPYLVRQIELIRPRVIVAFGTFAAQTLLETKLSIGKLRGTLHRYYGVPLIVTYHPAALLRNPAWKRPTWDDVQHARRILDRTGDGA
jgi:uracil-DNA glycosylase family 4